MGLFGWLKKAPEIKKAEFVSPATGKIIPVDQVEDETFASKILGDGFAVELTDGEVIAPFDGEVTAAFPTGHAYGLKREDGLECLIHIGLDTVELNGSGFDVKVKQGDQVKQGQVLVKVDLDQVTGAGSRIENVLERCNTGNVTEWNAIKTQIRDALGRYFFEKTKRRPMILPIIQEVR